MFHSISITATFRILQPDNDDFKKKIELIEKLLFSATVSCNWQFNQLRWNRRVERFGACAGVGRAMQQQWWKQQRSPGGVRSRGLGRLPLEQRWWTVVRGLSVLSAVARPLAVQTHVHLRLVLRQAGQVSDVPQPDQKLLLHSRRGVHAAWEGGEPVQTKTKRHQPRTLPLAPRLERPAHRLPWICTIETAVPPMQMKNSNFPTCKSRLHDAGFGWS